MSATASKGMLTLCIVSERLISGGIKPDIDEFLVLSPMLNAFVDVVPGWPTGS